VTLEGVGEQTAEDQEVPDPAAQSPTASQQNRSDDTDMEDVAQTQSGSEWGRDSGDFSISSSIDSIEEDKLEVLSNQMAVTFLGLLAAMEHLSHEKRERRVSLGSFAI
jgi:hypothetical protein